jgi:hypothetical protein
VLVIIHCDYHFVVESQASAALDRARTGDVKNQAQAA